MENKLDISFFIDIERNHNEFSKELNHIRKFKVFELNGRRYVTIEEYEAVNEAIINHHKGFVNLLERHIENLKKHAEKMKKKGQTQPKKENKK